MKFSEMTYTRPDIDALLARCKQLAAKAADAQDGDALIQVYYEQSRAFADYTTASQLANIHYTCDTRDAYWKAEQDFFDANGPAVTNASVEISRAFLANPYVDALTEHFGTTCVAGMKNAVLGMDDRTVELQQEFNALVSQYQQIYGGALVELDGKQLTIPQLGPYKEDLDPAVRRAAYEAEAGYFDAHRDELDALYTKIVKNLNQQAKVLGYKDYSELSYVRMNRIGYGPEEIRKFRDQVANDVVPQLQKVMAMRAKRTGIARQDGCNVLLHAVVVVLHGLVLPMPQSEEERELAAQFNEQILIIVRVLDHKSHIPVFHVVEVRLLIRVHGHLLAAQRRKQVLLHGTGIRDLIIIDICVHGMLLFSVLFVLLFFTRPHRPTYFPSYCRIIFIRCVTESIKRLTLLHIRSMLFDSNHRTHDLDTILIVQTQFKVMVDDRQLEPDGLQPLSVGLAFRIDLHLIDQNFHQSAAFRLGHGGIELVEANQDLIDVVACDFVGFNGLLLCPGIHQSIFHLLDFIVHLIKAVVKVRFSGDKVPVVRVKAVDLLHKPGFCGVVLP